MIRTKLEWIEDRFWIVYTFEIIVAVVLILYGIFSPDGFAAKGYK